MAKKKREKRVKMKVKRPLIKLTWSNVKFFLSACLLLEILLIFLAISTSYYAYQIYEDLAKYLDMISDGHDGTILCGILLLACVVIIPFHSLTFFVLTKTFNIQPSKKVNRLMRFLLWVNALIAFVLVGMGVMVMRHSYTFHDQLRDNIMVAMRDYSVNLKKKMLINVMQFKLQCCGSEGYRDWFGVDWYEPSYQVENNEMNSSTPISSSGDVPFSCCALYTHFPCIHHNLNNLDATAYDVAGDVMTISKNGCHGKIITQVTETAWKICGVIALFVIAEIFHWCSFRLIQTSHKENYQFFRSDGHVHEAYILKTCKKIVKEKSREELLPTTEELTTSATEQTYES